MTRRKRSENQAETRAKLLRAARTMVAEHGFAGASLEMIADAAGFSKGAIYSNFPSKDALGQALLQSETGDSVERFNEILTQPFQDLDSFRTRLVAMFEDHGKDSVTRALALQILIRAIQDETFRPAMNAPYQQRWALYVAMLEIAIARLGRPQDPDTRLIVEALAAMVNGHALLRAAGVAASPIGALMDLLLRRLIPGEPRASAADSQPTPGPDAGPDGIRQPSTAGGLVAAG
jgi:AcrR family transcriptional regulator